MLALLSLLGTGHVLIKSSSLANPAIVQQSAGAYGYFDMRILTGKRDHFFTKIEIDIPRGIQSVEMDTRPGWTFTYDQEPLTAEEQLAGHYGSASTRPSKVTMEANTPADAIKGSEIIVQHFGARFGCYFDDANTNTLWRGYHTAWWGTTVHMASTAGTLTADHVDAYTACGRTGNEPWFPSNFPVQKACAYTYVHSSDKCTTNGEGGDKGMQFLGTTIPPALNMAEITNEAHVLELIDASTGTLFDTIGARLVTLEASATKVSSLESDVSDLKDDMKKEEDKKEESTETPAVGQTDSATQGNMMSSLAYVALAVSILNLGAFLSLFLLRFFAPGYFHAITVAPTNATPVKTAPEQP